ncbi:unnamed protein product [Euphydryas editha]|uniref:RNA polymerase sigma-70 region 4 domain-containing protein n=1 Tax=Euphydryas editha TaxID=104508 RepID=A0AAU9U0E2_EUPED|nr:unnamed protein product [Euphydryas editha]
MTPAPVGRTPQSLMKTSKKVKKIIVLDDRRIKLWQITEELGVSKERVGDIMHNHLHMNKVSARWVPKMPKSF